MKGPSKRALGGLAVVALWGLSVWPVQGVAATPEDLTQSWYHIEAVIFQRAAVTWSDGVEDLRRSGERSYPAGVRTIENGAKTSDYDLSPLALATLEFPTLSYDCATHLREAPYRPLSVPSWQQPASADAAAASRDASDVAATPLDLPLAPGPSMPVCAALPGQRPPIIEPIVEPHPLLDWLGAAGRFTHQLQSESYRASLLGAMLRPEARRIAKSGTLELLWHGRWTQSVPPRGASEPLLVQAGRRWQGVRELEGTIDISLGRYLHFGARLWLHGPPSAETDGHTDPDAGPVSVPSADAGAIQNGTAPEPEVLIPYMVLEESRTMRSGTLHYLDHPMFGVLVRADPVEAPDWLVDASAAFQTAELGN